MVIEPILTVTALMEVFFGICIMQCIARPALRSELWLGLTTEREDESFVMEAAQGDTISGKISRGEVATVISAALKAPASKGKDVHAPYLSLRGSTVL